MERYGEVLGLPVICVENGKRIGIIKDIMFCPKHKEVIAFLLERKGCEIRKKVILLKDVLSLGKDALIVNDCKCTTTFKKLENTEEFKEKGIIKGLRVYAKTGEDLGIVNDILFDYKTGIIEGVEVSDGIFQDIILGRKVIPLFGRVEFGTENILIDMEALEEMRTTGGGLKRIINGELTVDKDERKGEKL